MDNALFLWRYDVPDDVPVEYAGEEQAIVAVAVATPKPGVFLRSIERLIVVATTTEIVLLGAAFENGAPSTSAGQAGGEPAAGVFMHDVVREYCRATVRLCSEARASIGV